MRLQFRLLKLTISKTFTMNDVIPVATEAAEPNNENSTNTSDGATVTVTKKASMAEKKSTDEKSKPHPKPLVLCGPSGSGKSTILKSVMAEDKYKNMLAFSVSHTTRRPRSGEEHGREYYFTDRALMLQDIKEDKFIEHAEYSGNLYGTSKESVQKCQSLGKICVLDIDSQGVKSLKKVPNLLPVYVFIRPPSLDTLEGRLRSRKTETEESLKKRLEAAQAEMEYGREPGAFDAVIINDELTSAVQQLRDVIDNNILDPLSGRNGCGDAAFNGVHARSGDFIQNADAIGDAKVNGDVSSDDIPVKRPKVDEDSFRDRTPVER